MTCTETSLPGVLIIEPDVYYDERGFFLECYQQQKFADFGVTSVFVQDNHSRSVKSTLRGLHYQSVHLQAKLCRVIYGEVLDVAVDIRRGSPFFGKWVGVNLSAENKRQLFIPKGFAHGFLVISDVAEFLYKCDDFYDPAHEMGLAWNDPSIGIDWGVDTPILSAKDAANPALSHVSVQDLPRYIAK